MVMNKNKRDLKEYKLVTDGKQMYRLAPKFNIPDGLEEVFEFEGKKVYTSKGKLIPKFQSLQRIQPRINLSRIAVSVCQALGLYSK